MSRGMKRAEMPPNSAAAVRALRACREAMHEVHRTVRPMNPVYLAASAVTKAIDGLAHLLTGDPEYFWTRGHANGSDLTREDDKLAREKGEKPGGGSLRRTRRATRRG